MTPGNRIVYDGGSTLQGVEFGWSVERATQQTIDTLESLYKSNQAVKFSINDGGTVYTAIFNRLTGLNYNKGVRMPTSNSEWIAAACGPSSSVQGEDAGGSGWSEVAMTRSRKVASCPCFSSRSYP